MRILLFLVLAGALSGQVPPTDSRNTRVPNTDTYFHARDYASLSQWEEQRKHLRSQILFAAGLLPAPEKTPLNAQVFGQIEREKYMIEKVLLETLPGFYLGGNLYRPKGNGPFPAIVKPHGHWTYGRLENQPLNSTQTLAANFARQGYVVFAYDMVGYNDTAQIEHRETTRREQLWAMGPLGLQLWNSMRAVDFLESLTYVDRTRIGATGASGGGTQVFVLSAVDERIAAAAPVNMVSSIMQGGCVCENAPGLRVDTFNVETAAMMAPRPLLLVAATGDWTRNVPSEEFPSVRNVYALYGKTENVETVQVDAPHNYNQESRVAVYRFFAKHLLGRQDADGIDEENTPVEPAHKMLALYGLSLPPNAVNREGLFEWWRKNATRQVAAIGDPASLRELLRQALKVGLPDSVISESDGERISLTRPGKEDRVSGLWINGKGKPALVVHPDGAAAGRESEETKKLVAAGRPVLLIDAFQTGPARAPRDRSHQHFLTFNLTDDANRVQDILTALAFLREKHPGPAELVGVGDAAVWALFAAAMAPGDLSLDADPGAFRGTDEELLKRFFAPGLQRAGGLQTALRLTESMR